MTNLFRIYEPSECGADGYPIVWHKRDRRRSGVKSLVRVQAGDRCVRCQHPFIVGQTPGEWSPCDGRCNHRGPARLSYTASDGTWVELEPHQLATSAGVVVGYGKLVEAHWRVLTVHHLNGVKADLRWWNLAALCQRCHLEIQGRVRMEQVYPHEHSPWFKPYAAGYYAATYLGEDLTREQTEDRLDELLSLELAA
jgi:hypothetical protein